MQGNNSNSDYIKNLLENIELLSEKNNYLMEKIKLLENYSLNTVFWKDTSKIFQEIDEKLIDLKNQLQTNNYNEEELKRTGIYEGIHNLQKTINVLLSLFIDRSIQFYKKDFPFSDN